MFINKLLTISIAAVIVLIATIALAYNNSKTAVTTNGSKGFTDAEVLQPAVLEISMHEIDERQYIVTDNVTHCQTIVIRMAGGITSFPRTYPSGAQVCGDVHEGMAEWNEDGSESDPNYEELPETDIEKGFPKSVPSKNQPE